MNPSPPVTLDVAQVRARFPAFSQPALQRQAFFENAGGSYPCAPVVERLTRFYRERKVQPYGPYAASRLAGAEMDEARTRLSALLGVAPDELTFGPSTSQNSYVLAQSFRQILPRGAAIVVTDQDHEANSGVWRRLGEAGLEIREWRIDPDSGHLDPAGLAALHARLSALPATALRGDVLPERVPAAGLLILRDGEPGEPEVTLSPLRCHYQHRVEIEAVLKGAARDTALDALCVSIGAAIAADRRLGGLCDWVGAEAPQPVDLPMDGAANLKAAVIPVVLHYSTADPLPWLPPGMQGGS